MPAIPLEHGLAVAGILFCLGLVGLMVRRNILFVLMSLEIMMNAGLAGQQHLVAVCVQGLADGIDGGGLARAFAAFQADKARVAQQRGGHCGAAWLRCWRNCCRYLATAALCSA